MNIAPTINTLGDFRRETEHLRDETTITQVNPVGKEGPPNIYINDDMGMPRVLIYEGKS